MNRDVVQGIHQQAEMFLNLTQRLTLLIEHENRLMLSEGREYAVLQNQPLQEQKFRLFSKFDNFARVLSRCIAEGHLTDRPLIDRLIGTLLSFRRHLTLNNAMLEHYLQRKHAMVQQIMRAIEEKRYVADDRA